MQEPIIMLQTQQFELIKAMTQILQKEYNRTSSIKAMSLSERHAYLKRWFSIFVIYFCYSEYYSCRLFDYL